MLQQQEAGFAVLILASIIQYFTLKAIPDLVCSVEETRGNCRVNRHSGNVTVCRIEKLILLM